MIYGDRYAKLYFLQYFPIEYVFAKKEEIANVC
jgi:hypothetical protein